MDLMNPHDGLRLLYMIQGSRPAEFEIVGCKLTPIFQKENTMHVAINGSKGSPVGIACHSKTVGHDACEFES